MSKLELLIFFLGLLIIILAIASSLETKLAVASEFMEEFKFLKELKLRTIKLLQNKLSKDYSVP